MSRRDHQHVPLSRGQRADVLFERRGVERQIPLINPHRMDPRSAGFQSRDEAAIGDAVFLHCHVLVGHENAAVDGRQQLPPGVRLGDAVGGGKADLPHGGQRLGAADDRHHVPQRIEEPLAVHVLFDGC